jgi:hypothetical protein
LLQKKLTNKNIDNETDMKTNEKNVCNFQQRKEKKRKGKKRKEEKRKELSLPPQGSLSREEEAEREGMIMRRIGRKGEDILNLWVEMPFP